jgi:putative ABC transport system permease protein
VRAIDRKAVRDLWHIKGQALAIALVIASGIGTFVMSLSTLKSLSQSKDAYYERYRFAHVFAHVKRAPLSLARRIAEIPGVAQVQPRIVVDVTLDVPGMSEPAIGRLISVPERRMPMVNDIHLRRGRWIEPQRAGEVLVGEAFADSHQLQIGDSVTAVINGRRQKLAIAGIALSPEYIIQIHGANLLPDDERFGIFWMGYEQLAAAFNMDGAFNDLALTLTRGASEAEVIQRLDDLTRPYGARGANGRKDHVSHQYISDEIRQLRNMGLIAPSIFFSVAVFLLNVVMTRQIGVQREQIAALKAFGYTKLQIGLHYIKVVLLIALIGTLLGIAVGSILGRSLTNMYTTFYRFPVFGFQWDAAVVFGSLAISATAAVGGTLTAVRRAIRLPPAEAMRPEPPAVYRPTLMDRSGLGDLLPQAARMVFRELERKPVKAGLSCVGVAMAVAILVLGSFTLDSINYIIDFQFFLSQRQDLMVFLVEPSSPGALHELEHLPGVIRCEPIRSAATRFRFGHRSRRVGIIGLSPGGRLYRTLDVHERLVPLPSDGLLLSSKLAELLGVRLGDRILVEVLEGEQPVREVPVSALVTEYGGTNAYMDMRALHKLLREGDLVAGAFMTVQRDRQDELYRALKNTPHVSGITIKEASVNSFKKTIAENLGRIRFFNILFATVIAFGVVYNSARISLAERSRDLATLRVIGFTRAEISAILLGELAVVTLAAIPLGLLVGYGFAWWAVQGLDTEVYRIPLIVHRATFGFAAVVVLAGAAVSGLIVRERLDHLDLIAVLKTRE